MPLRQCLNGKEVVFDSPGPIFYLLAALPCQFLELAFPRGEQSSNGIIADEFCSHSSLWRKNTHTHTNTHFKYLAIPASESTRFWCTQRNQGACRAMFFGFLGMGILVFILSPFSLDEKGSFLPSFAMRWKWISSCTISPFPEHVRCHFASSGFNALVHFYARVLSSHFPITIPFFFPLTSFSLFT